MAPTEEKKQEAKPEQIISRQERRLRERIEQEAKDTYALLTNKFFEYFMTNSPDSDEVTKLEREVIAKWKMYCKMKDLTKETLPLVERYCAAVREQCKKDAQGDIN